MDSPLPRFRYGQACEPARLAVADVPAHGLSRSLAGVSNGSATGCRKRCFRILPVSRWGQAPHFMRPSTDRSTTSDGDISEAAVPVCPANSCPAYAKWLLNVLLVVQHRSCTIRRNNVIRFPRSPARLEGKHRARTGHAGQRSVRRANGRPVRSWWCARARRDPHG